MVHQMMQWLQNSIFQVIAKFDQSPQVMKKERALDGKLMALVSMLNYKIFARYKGN